MADTEKSTASDPPSSSSNEQEKDHLANGQPPNPDEQKHPPAASSEDHSTSKPKNEDEKNKKDNKDKKDSDEPAGGYDSTPIPKTPPGWTVKITFVRATNLPMADINTLSSDPYVSAQLYTTLPTRHKEDPPLRFRTQTVRRETDPVWNSSWTIANVPSSGFRLKARLYDEDPADHDDRLGNVHVNVGHIDEQWPGIKEQGYSIKKRMGSKRAYLARAVATCVRVAKHMSGELFVSIEVLGRTKDENGGRMYTVGPTWWVKHYSPMLGRITGQKEEKDGSDPKQGGHVGPDEKTSERKKSVDSKTSSKKKGGTQRYNFQANQMQLPGPVPAELYHRYVEFKPFVHGMFTHHGIRGFLLNKALHHQHARVYNYDRSTLWGYIPEDDPEALTKRFLELVHYDKGGKIFTYVLTLDALIRFTETGKEFGIDMLSKHSMHSDVEIYIAFSGEFFIRRHRHKNQANSTAAAPDHSAGGEKGPDPSKPAVGEEAEDSTLPHDSEGQETGEVASSNPVAAETKEVDSSDLDPSNYELIIDNDSGTYRPNAELLPLFRLFLQRSFPGLHVRVLDCQKDEEKMGKLKQEQRDRKKAEAGGEQVVFAQRARGASLSSQSSSDDEEFDALAAGGSKRGFRKQIQRDAQWRAGAKVQHFKNFNPKTKRGDASGGQVEDEGHVDDEGRAVGKQQDEEQNRDKEAEKNAEGTETGPAEKTAAERTAEEKGHEYDPEEKLEGMGQGQPIGRPLHPKEEEEDKGN